MDDTNELGKRNRFGAVLGAEIEIAAARGRRSTLGKLSTIIMVAFIAARLTRLSKRH